MDIDPALKGTTFGAALEAGLAAERARREAREAEISLKEEARLKRVKSRRHTADDDGLPFQEAIHGIDDIAQRFVMPAPSVLVSVLRRDDFDTAQTLDKGQIRALAIGVRDIKDGRFALHAGQASGAGPLIESGLITRLSSGVYQITVRGERVYAACCIIARGGGPTDATDAAENSHEPDTSIEPNTPDETHTLDDTGEDTMTDTDTPIGTLTATMLSILESGTTRETFVLTPKQRGSRPQRLVDAGLIVHADKGHYSLTEAGRAAYTEAQAANALTSDDTDSLDDRTDHALWKDAADERQRKIDALTATLGVMQDQLTQVGQENAQLRESTAGGFNDLYATLETLLALRNDDGSPLDLVAYVKDLRTRAATGSAAAIHWYTLVITPLIDLMLADGGITVTRTDITDDPAIIVRYVEVLRQSQRNLTDIADERAKTIDEHAGKIESLNRCIEQMEAKMIALEKSARHGDETLAIQILEELCDMVPEIESYRAGREAQVKAIGALKARRS